MLSIDQLDTLKKVRSPLLIVQGGMDTSVSPQKTNEMMLRLKEIGRLEFSSGSLVGTLHGLLSHGLFIWW